MENQHSTRPKRALNVDRYAENGVFPSVVYAAMKQLTQSTGGSTFLFSGKALESGYVVGNGTYGLVYNRKNFYSEDCLETQLDPFFNDFRAYGYQGIGTWFDEKCDLVCVDPIDVFDDINEALEIAKAYDERSIYDVANKKCIPVP